VSLRSGPNTIAYRYDNGDSGNVNLDWLQVRQLGAYQAEEGSLVGGAKPRTSHAGFSGRGFVAGFESTGASTELNVTADHTGQTSLTLRYANAIGSDGQSTTRTLGLWVNGSRFGQVSLPPTGSWDTWASRTETVSLRAGANTIAYQRDAGDSGKANLDQVTVFQPPPTPTISSIPASPSSDNTPEIRGGLGGGSPAQVKVYRNATCSGTPDATGAAAQFTGVGITVSVPSDATTPISAQSTDSAGNNSGCSDNINYTEDSTPPPAPTWTGTNPSGPANDNFPWLTGVAAGASTVSIFVGGACSGVPAATDSVETFASPGIPVTVDDDSSTAFSASATDAAGNTSACSTTIGYDEDSIAPGITPRGAQRQHLRGGRVTIGADCDESCGLAARFDVLRYSHGRRYVLRRHAYTARSWTGRFSRRFLLSKSIIRRLKHLPHGERIVVSFVLNAKDPAGNVATTPYRVQLLR
jgi:hypothetical protein